jgi:hypothetical protein
MKALSSSLVVVVCATAATLAAGIQSMDKGMGKDSKGKATGAMESTYTGCVESVNHGAAFVLTHITDGRMDATHDMPMKSNTPKNGGMPMEGDTSMSHDSMTPKADGAGAMDPAAMRGAPSTVLLNGRSDFAKHVGEKVSVSGTLSKASPGSMRDDLDALSVASLKVVAKACSLDGK